MTTGASSGRGDLPIRRARPRRRTVGPGAGDEWRYTYPDGAHNAEAMLVDADGSLIIVTKPPRAGYRTGCTGPNPAAGNWSSSANSARRQPPAAADPVHRQRGHRSGSAPGRVLLLTYDDVQEYTAPDPAAALSTFPDWPHRRLPMPALPQAEGIATDGCGYTVASEAGPAGTTGPCCWSTAAEPGAEAGHGSRGRSAVGPSPLQVRDHGRKRPAPGHVDGHHDIPLQVR